MKTFQSILKIAFLLVFVLTFFCNCRVKQTNLNRAGSDTSTLNSLSESFLKAVRENEDPSWYIDTIAGLKLEDIQSGLPTDVERYAFWINLYNAYIQVVLKAHPELYEDRGSFFAEDRLDIAGRKISFETIEDGILRKSQWGLGMGYVRKWFPGEFERKLRVNKRDYRIHFALNCGAADCPPIVVYTTGRLEEQLEKGSQLFLERSTRYESTGNTVFITALFSWFRGDFGGKSGTREILYDRGLIPLKKGVRIEYTNYDWTLKLDNFIDL